MENVLLVIDLQPAFRVDPYYDMCIDWIKENKNNYDKVLATRFINKLDSVYTNRLNYFGAMTREKLEFPYDELFSKYTYDCGMGFYKQLKNSHVDVIGCDTDACVLSICFELFKYNIDFSVLQDYCYSAGGNNIHNAALDIIYRNCGDVIK